MARFSYIPPTGLDDVPVIVSQLNPLVSVYNVTDLLIEGITFKHASSGGFSNLDIGNAAALRISESDGILVTDCEFTQTGMTGVFGAYSQNVRVTKSAFSDIGFVGVQFHDKDTKDYGQKNILIDNNRGPFTYDVHKLPLPSCLCHSPSTNQYY